MGIYCVNCQEILSSRNGKLKMIELGYSPRSDLIKRRLNYPFGKKSKPQIIPLFCKNCGGIKFQEDKVFKKPQKKTKNN